LLSEGWRQRARPSSLSGCRSRRPGPGALRLARDGEATTVRLTQRKPKQAAKLGIVAQPGKGRIMLGSVLETEVVVTINRQTIAVAPRAGENGGIGPRLDLPPGKYKISIKILGKPAFEEKVNVVLGETTGLLVGPGSVLPMQVY
jgi:hypothetical protein